MAATLEVKYFNTFWLKKIKAVTDDANADVYQIPRNYTSSSNTEDWYIEESRIRGGYNNTSTGYGAKAYIVEEESTNQNLFSSLIYSGVFNSRTGVNNTNQFSVGEDITRSVDPANGSIQKLYAEDTNLIIFQENKVSRALIDKDAIYSAEGNATVTSTQLVIGQVVAYAGEYGISKDPFSFAVYGYRKYFTDRKRNAVLRLSRDGITEISSYGMHDYFRDQLSGKNTGNGAGYSVTRVIGGWDIHTKNYVLSIQGEAGAITYAQTLSFDESVLGWTSRFSYGPEFIVSVGPNMFSYNKRNIYQHHLGTTWYGVGFGSDVTIVLNANPSLIKNFKTLNYEVTDKWSVSSIVASSEDTAYNIGAYTEITSLSSFTTNLFSNNFKKKENKFFANLLNSSPVTQGEVVFGGDVSGLKGFFLTLKIGTTVQSQELFSVSSNTVESSY
jgi:hypothetical protein